MHTRFPPEPNGYLHIGHAKAICIDFGTAEKFGGLCNLRMDDTNPDKEDVEYVDAIRRISAGWAMAGTTGFIMPPITFETMYQVAVGLIKKGLAYVCERSPEQMREMRGRPDSSGGEPLPRSPDGRESGAVRPDAGGGICGLRRDAAGQNRP